MEAAGGVLQRCDPDLLEPSRDSEQQDCAGSAEMVLHLKDRRSVLNVLARQLFVMDSMMFLVEGLKSVQELMTLRCPPQTVGGAPDRWKALKEKTRAQEQETEALLRSLQDKIQQTHNKRNALKQLIQSLQDQKHNQKQLQSSLLTAQNALQMSSHLLTRLGAESEASLSQLISWQQLRDELQADISASQDVVQINLLSFSQSELCLELRPRPCSDLPSNEPESLKLSVTWSHDDRFRLQSSEGPAGLVDDGLTGRRSDLSAALLEVMQRYMGQFQLLSEIQGLRSRFAIDWCPAQRELVYMKSASLVCHLEVEDGYPRVGRARLQSVLRGGRQLDTSGLKPCKADLSLTEWLVFLCSSPLL